MAAFESGFASDGADQVTRTHIVRFAHVDEQAGHADFHPATVALTRGAVWAVGTLETFRTVATTLESIGAVSTVETRGFEFFGLLRLERHLHFQARCRDFDRRIGQVFHAFEHLDVRTECAGFEGFADLAHEFAGARGFHFFDGRKRHRLERGFHHFLDESDTTVAEPGGEGDRGAGTSRTTRTTDSVHIILGIVRDVVVEHDIDIVDINATSGHVGRDQKIEVATTELAHHGVALALLHVAMQHVAIIAACAKVLNQGIGLHFRVGEDESELEIFHIHDAADRFGTHRIAHFHDELLNVRRRGDAAVDADRQRIHHLAVDDVADRSRYRGREHHGLRLFGAVFRDVFDVFAEAHVQHFIGLIQHEHGELGDVERAAFKVIDHTSWRSDHDVGGTFEGFELAVDGLSTIHRHDMDAFLELTELHQLTGDLDGQFAGRTQHKRLHVAVFDVDVLEGRNTERGGFAGSGLGLAQHITPFAERGNALVLDGGGGFEAHHR